MARKIISSGYGTSASFDADFKETFDNGVQKQYPNWLPIVGWIKDNGKIKSRKLEGKFMSFYLELHPGSNAGARGEDATLPTTDNPSGVQAHVDYMRGFKGQFEITAEAMHYGKGDAGVFTDVMKQSVNSLKFQMKRLAGPAFWGDGTGRIACTGAASVLEAASVTLNVSETYNTCYPGNRWLHIGQRIGILSSAGTPIGSSMDVLTGSNTIATTTRISNFTGDTACSLSAVSSLMANGAIFNIGDVSAGDVGETYWGPDGILALVDGTFRATYASVSSSTYSQWKGVESHNSGTLRPQTTTLFYQNYFKVGRQIGSVDHNKVAWTNPDVYQDLLRLMEPNVAYRPKMKGGLGFEKINLMVNGVNIPIKLDYYCPSYWFMLSPEDIYFINSRPMGLVPDKKGNVLEPVDNKTNFKMKYWWGCNMYTDHRNHHGIIKDLDITITSTF